MNLRKVSVYHLNVLSAWTAPSLFLRAIPAGLCPARHRAGAAGS